MATAGIRVEVNALHLPVAAEIAQEAVPLEFAVDEHISETIAPFVDLARSGDAALGKLGTEQTVARRLARMDTFDLRAFVEVLTDAADEAAGQSQRVERLRRIQLEQARHRRRRPEHARHRRVVEAFARSVRMHRRRRARHHVVTDDGGEQHLPRACTILFRGREYGREDGARRVRRTVGVTVVEVETVGVRAVDQGRIGRGQLRAAADDRRDPGRVVLAEIVEQRARHRHRRPRDRTGHVVQQRPLGRVDRARRQMVVARVRDVRGDFRARACFQILQSVCHVSSRSSKSGHREHRGHRAKAGFVEDHLPRSFTACNVLRLLRVLRILCVLCVLCVRRVVRG